MVGPQISVHGGRRRGVGGDRGRIQMPNRYINYIPKQISWSLVYEILNRFGKDEGYYRNTILSYI